MFQSSLQKTSFYIRWFSLVLSTRSPKQQMIAVKLPLLLWLKKYPFALKFLLKMIFPFKSKDYINLMFAMIYASYDEIEILLEKVPAKDSDVRTLKIGRKQDFRHSRLDASIEKASLIAENFNLSKSLYEPLALISNLDLKHQLVSNRGMANIGLVIHTQKDIPVYFTKIKNHANQPIEQSIEKHFYTDIRENSVALKKFTPKLISLNVEKNFAFLTMEYVNGRRPQIGDIKMLLEFNKTLLKINFDYIENNLNKGVQPYILSPKRIFTPISKNQNKELINNIFKSARQRISNVGLEETQLKIEKIILKNNLHKKINIKKDLILQHHDFGGHNSKITQDGTLVVFDWDWYSLAIPGIDFMKFIMHFTIDFNVISEKLFSFLKEENISNFDVITCYLTLQYLNRLVQQPNGVRIQENWDLDID